MNPIQSIINDDGTKRFKANAIVRYLLDNGGIDMNRLAALDFPREDRVQFAQLIGYSLSGFGELSYVSDADYEAAELMSKDEVLTAQEALIEHYEAKLSDLKAALREPIAKLYEMHPDDLGGEQ